MQYPGMHFTQNNIANMKKSATDNDDSKVVVE